MAGVRVQLRHVALAAVFSLGWGVPTGAQMTAGPPPQLLGWFEDDYAGRYEITEAIWVAGSDTLRVEEWRMAEREVLLTSESPTGETTWTRIDWVDLPEASAHPGERRWVWAWCMASWDARTRDAALEVTPSRRDEPRSGCGDNYPFTRMRPASSGG